ncbi:PQQ-binding-like beta-propeller repeat protein [Streptomyces sp. NPDC005486]|uniref:PQQ-like beta-propeller repeat protein n=1 Tax=Streptomyces sp. NPDC005486 TaxID=3155345 RepID=UPI0033A7E8F5
MSKPQMRDTKTAKEHSNSVHDTKIQGGAQIIVGDHGKMVNIFSPGLIALALAVLVVVAISVAFMAEPWKPADRQRADPTTVRKPVSPVEEGGRFYLTDDAGYLSALDLRTGKELWSFHQAGTTEISLARTGASRIYAGTSGRSVNGLHALDASNGDAIWSKTNNSCAGNPVGTAESTLVVDTNGYLCGLDKETGKEEWRVEGTSCIFGDPDTLYLNTERGITALNAVTGSTIWRSPGLGGELIYAAGNLYLKTETTFQEIDSRTGKRGWGRNITDLEFKDASTSTSELFFMSKTESQAIDANTGQLVWRFASPETKDLKYSSNSVYILANGKLVALSEKVGVKRWTQEVPGGYSLYVHHGKITDLLYVLGELVSAVRPENGKFVWYASVWSTGHPPALADGAAAIAQDGNDVTTLDPWNGATRWTYTSRGQVVSISYSGSPTTMDILDNIR